MDEDKKIYVISVESRKGGVGKTTAALNLANVFLDDGFSVLLLDLDITGTNAVDIIESYYWKNKVSAVKCDGNVENLLSLFKDKFLVGSDIPKWSYYKDKNDYKKTINKNNDFVFINDQINIFGSQIYDFEFKDDLKAHSIKTICQPNILFDELHSYWFIEFLKNIINHLIKIIPRDGKVVFILDNSPGYNGLVPEIHDWLSDLGPKCAKILTISSEDTQDIIACMYSYVTTNNIFESKLKALHIFASKKEKEQSEMSRFNEIQKTFFVKLIEEKHIEYSSIDVNSLHEINKNIPSNYEKNYQVILFNKLHGKVVLDELLKVVLKINNENIFVKKFKSFYTNLEIKKIIDKLESLNVEYNGQIERQFHHSSVIEKEINNNLIKYQNIKKKLRNIVETIDKIKPGEYISDLLCLRATQEIDNSLIEKVLSYEELLKSIKNELIKLTDYHNILTIINRLNFDNYLSNNIIYDLQKVLDFELSTTDHVSIKHSKFNTTYNSYLRNILNLIDSFGLQVRKSIPRDIIISAKLLALILSIISLRIKKNDFLKTFEKIIIIQSYLLIEYSKSQKSISLPQFLNSINVKAVEKLYKKFKFEILSYDETILISKGCELLSKAQAFLFNIEKNILSLAQFINELFSLLVSEELHLHQLNSDELIKKFDEIKTLKPEDRMTLMKTFLMNFKEASCMFEFQNELKNIKQKWVI